MSHSDPSIRHQIDQVCDRFERSLKNDDPCRIEDFLADVPNAYQDELRRELEALLDDYRSQGSPFDATIDQSEKTAGQFDATIDGSQASPLPSITVGDTFKYFGDYEILDEIARGGMGVVYRARQTSLGRIVALKMILSGQLAGDHEIARFRSEAESAANLDHPGIVPIYEVGRHHNHHYFSMGLIDGPSLSDVLRDGPMQPHAAAECLAKIADAVDYANAKGVIHRDLKPGNILLDSNGEPHITDFGLAKRLQADTELTTSGEILGTPAYMPPEQARGDLDAIGPASDVYALGAILYAMLSGRPPHTAPSMVETLRQVIEVDVISVRSLSPGVPKDLETICAKCLAKEPAKRYPVAGELKQELQRFLRGEPIHARPVSRFERTWRWAKRHPAMAGLSTALLLLISTLAIGGPAVAVNQSRLKNIAEVNEARANVLAESERQAAASEREATDRANRSLYARTVSLAFQELQSGNLMGAEDMLASLPAADRGFEWRYVHSLCQRQQQTFLDMNEVPRFVEIAPDGVHVIAAGQGITEKQKKVYVWQIGQDLAQAIRDQRGLAVSRDGATMVTVPAGETTKFQVVDAITGDVRQTIDGHEAGTEYATFGGPAESLIATVGRDKTYRVWDIQSGKELLKITVPHRQRLHPIALSPDGKTIAWRRGDDGAIELRETKQGNVRFEGAATASMKHHDAPIQFSPDGNSIAVGAFGEVNLIDANSGASIGNFYGIRARAISLDFSPDGGRLVVGSQDGTIRVFDVANRKLLTSITGHKAGATYGVVAVAFDSSGDRIVSGGFDSEVKVWDAWNGDRLSIADSTRSAVELPAPDQSADFVTTMEHSVEQLKFSSDGKYLLTAARNASAAIIDPKSGETVFRWNNLVGNQGAIDFDSTAGRIVLGSGSIIDRQPGPVVAMTLQDGEELWRFEDTRGPVSCLRFIQSGRQVIVAVGSQNTTIGSLIMLNAETGELIWRNQQSMLPVRDLAVSPDETTIATVGLDQGVTLWDARSGEKQKQIGDRNCFAVDYSADGKRIAVGGLDWSVRLLDADSGLEIWSSIRHAGAVTRVVFAQNDTRLITTSVDGHTRIWDTRYGDSILQMRDSDQANFALAVSPDASTIAVSGINPNIVLRRIPAAESQHEIGPDGRPLDEDSWVTVIDDDFNRDEVGDRWHAVGQWAIQDGVLVGSLGPTQFAPGLNAANLTSKTMLPSNHRISFDVWIDSPMVVEAKVSDIKFDGIRFDNAISCLFVGMQASPFNRSEKGVAVVQAFRSNFRELASRREGSFTFDIGRKYRLASRRIGDQVDLFIDDELYRTVQLAVETPLPMMSLQGAFGSLGGKIHFDNVLVQIPPDAVSELQAAEVVARTYERERFKPLVLAKLKQMDASKFGDDPVTTRQAALKMAANWFQDDGEILDKIESMATKGDADPDTYIAILEWMNASIRLKTERTYRAASMCAFRAKRIAECWEALKQADQIHGSKVGYRHPIDLSISAMLLFRGGKLEIATSHLRQVNQIVLADHWQADNQTNAWVELARETIELPELDPAFEALANVTWQVQRSLLIEGDASPLTDSLADSAVRVVRRNPGEDKHASTTKRQDWITSEKIWAMGGYASLKKLIRVSCNLSSDSPTPVMTSRFVLTQPDLSFGWIQNDVFKSEPGIAPEHWKIVKQDWRLFRLQAGPETFDIEKDGWDELDRRVDVAIHNGNAMEQLFRLMAASRLDEALQVAKRIGEEEQTDWTDKQRALAQAHLAEIAQWCGETETLMAAAKRAVELDPMVRGPSAIRAIAAKSSFADKPFDFAKDASVRVPTFYRWASTKLLAAGDFGRGCWQPTDDSLIGIIELPTQPETSLAEYLTSIIESRKAAYSAKTIRRTRRQLDGYPVEEFVQRGLGVGRAITNSGRSTIQRFTMIDRVGKSSDGKIDGDRLLVFVTAYEDDFEKREAEYEQFLRSMKLHPVMKQVEK